MYNFRMSGFIPIHPIKEDPMHPIPHTPCEEKSQVGILESAIEGMKERDTRMENSIKAISNSITTVTCFLDSLLSKGGKGCDMGKVVEKILILEEFSEASVRILQSLRNTSEGIEKALIELNRTCTLSNGHTRRIEKEIRKLNDQSRKDSKPAKNKPSIARTRKNSAKQPSKVLRRHK
jgi:hypothetical protein